jgi:hypothetical protein
MNISESAIFKTALTQTMSPAAVSTVPFITMLQIQSNFLENDSSQTLDYRRKQMNENNNKLILQHHVAFSLNLCTHKIVYSGRG